VKFTDAVFSPAASSANPKDTKCLQAILGCVRRVMAKISQWLDWVDKVDWVS